MRTATKVIKNSTGFLLWQATNRWQKVQKKALKTLDLTYVQFILLSHVCYLEEEIEKVSQALLATRAETDLMMTSQVVRTLIDKGLITRKNDLEDSRAVCLQTTAKGRKKAVLALKIVEEEDENFFKKISDLPDFSKNLNNLVRYV